MASFHYKMKSNFQQIISFIKSIYEDREFIPLHEPLFFGNEKKYLEECVDSTFVSSIGRFVDLFEEKITEYTGAERAVACVNGTAALHLALILSDIHAGDEVVTQPLSFIATANAIAYTGAKPIFVDIDRDTLGLSPEKLAGFLEKNTRIENKLCINKASGKVIRCCIPMHTYGNPCRIDEIVEICEKYHIIVIEDAAESIGSFYKGKHTGTFGQIGTLSFNGNKTMTTGGGGMLLIRDNEIGKRAKHLSTQAKVNHPWEFYHDETGYNYRMPNINAALGVAQLEKLDLMLECKQKLWQKYTKFFKTLDIPSIQEIPESNSNHWLNGFFLESKKERDEFLEYSISKGVHCRPAWNLLSTLPMYKDCQVDNIDNAKRIADTLISIPSSVPL